MEKEKPFGFYTGLIYLRFTLGLIINMGGNSLEPEKKVELAKG